MEYNLFFSFFIIFSGAAVLATISLYTHQPIIVAYVALGVIAGPSVMGWVGDAHQLGEIAHIGIVFLLFLLGLDMQPKSLAHVLKKASLVAIASSLIFFATGYLAAISFGFNQTESLVTGAALMFSSTIIGIKLLPTTVLHHKHMGELMVGLLLLQDMIAIITLLVLGGATSGGGASDFAITAIALPCLILFSYYFVKWVILPLLVKFDLFHEYLFLMAIGWCLGVAELGAYLGLSKEMGAFVAGITLATHPVAQFMTEKLKPIRDFFLVLFFFTLGAGFKLHVLADIWLYALILSALVIIIKPVTFKLLLNQQSEKNTLSWDIGFRLGQISEFSLLISYLAIASNLIGENAAHTIQATAVITFIVSTYIVIFKYPNPIAPSSRLRRD
ncbi:cation:proton antiporter [Oceaniserpentilla sp. 4NH20-0058]|uniref:cation:proton antiporter n=1 Tax=Oceaniserpentilla sp. 4NH20-0058 TaxID=3127660 RepID=UPI00310C2DBC